MFLIFFFPPLWPHSVFSVSLHGTQQSTRRRKTGCSHIKWVLTMHHAAEKVKHFHAFPTHPLKPKAFECMLVCLLLVTKWKCTAVPACLGVQASLITQETSLVGGGFCGDGHWWRVFVSPQRRPEDPHKGLQVSGLSWVKPGSTQPFSKEDNSLQT